MKPQISAVILAGGLARRMNGVEKGLQLLQGKPLISHLLARLSPQIDTIWLNINRSLADYQAQFPDLPFYSDHLPNFQGALSGMLSAFEQIDSDLILFVPCDAPFVPHNLAAKLHTALRINQAQIAYAHDGERPHPTCAILHRAVMPALQNYLAQGERRLLHFFQSQKSVAVDFSEQATAFQNFNTLADLATPRLPSAIPTLAITGYSGTGKTTLLEKLIPELTACNLRVGLIKHSHHNVEVDKAGKDSHRLRLAGANPTMIVCDQRWALMCETSQAVGFSDILAQFDPQQVDLILVEGFKHEPIPKIQLHRRDLDRPLPEQDQWTVAYATDYPIKCDLPCLDLNQIPQIADFILQYRCKI
ncbi:bifunctional molybdenum cofactor guanylyltransferase MobA/molybdopterin-guanine dinucleotide biosynthesis adaptor protein MobB [Haemophilus paracuniculus]|uniref:Molybdenum cofactor guanylyltransferase n=1 Tax=Haemophilus paracuniculus TaxID=734 RepID=A0A1T0AQ70_9PAST|nr:molybdenum cofactor guanylyltransferase MobA [Haemophilus paracuniculus]OOR98317.1 bifunctional molybdenum cofactor guanylyltransferase MobA/molybdopterin-guanine dinucleotide biosynthesis adaptor protein MobB [Haemophilus paracuniculus]